jgi:AraC-like DNA-binding protein
MNLAPAETPIAFIRSIVRAYERYGKDPQRALHYAQIPPSLLKRSDARVTAAQMENFSGFAMRELDDEALGWFSRPLRYGANGMLCRASLPSANLHVALSRWCRHYALLTEDIRLELSVDGAIASLSIDEQSDLGEQREFCLVSSFRNIHGYACWLVDSRIPLSHAAFPFSPPPHAKAYEWMFRGPVSFDQPRACLSFDAQYLNLPVLRDDRDLRQMLERPLPLIVLQYRRDRLLSRRIRELLRARSMELSNAEALANELNLSTRSLYRHLADEGASLQQLKDEVRRDVAIEQLTRTKKPVKQIAVAAGFRNEASFNRAFKDWTGRTPGEFRKLPEVEVRD